MMLTDKTPALEPVSAFHEGADIETQLKALTMEVFAQFLRAQEREINTYGTPHLAGFDLVERWVKSDGLSMVRGNSQDAMRYLFKAWRGRNPRRGLHFLRSYLQLLWPGGWSVDQLWQKKGVPYTSALFTREDLRLDGVSDPTRDYFLTSRINVDVATTSESGQGVSQVSRSLLSVCGAKYVVRLRTLRRSATSLSVASIGTPSHYLSSSGLVQLLKAP